MIRALPAPRHKLTETIALIILTMQRINISDISEFSYE